MATAVPAVDRAATVLSYLRDRQFEAHALSDIARGTGIHKATCASILAAMTSHGLVSRDDSRRYTLGPELVRLAHSYRARYRAYTVGREELFTLATDVGLSCSATVIDGSEMVILDIVGDEQPHHLPQRVGRRLPLSPPNGTIFKAWSSPEELEGWLGEMERHFGGDPSEHLAVVAAIRARGFSLGGEHDFHVELDRALRLLSRNGADTSRVAVAALVADKIRNYEVAGAESGSDDELFNYLVGPVFGHDGRVVMSVNLFGQPGEIRRRDLARLTPRLLQTTSKITEMIGGVRPLDYGVTL